MIKIWVIKMIVKYDKLKYTNLFFLYNLSKLECILFDWKTNIACNIDFKF